MGWAKYRHSNLNRHQIVSRYWLVNKGGGWVFKAKGKEGATLYLHRNTHFKRHTKVQAARSPYDGDWAYWGSRLRAYSGLPSLMSFLLRQQNGKCNHCGLSFLPTDLIEMHHRDGNHENHQRQNLELLHCHCHDQVHAAECSNDSGTHDKSLAREKPDDAKGSSPVLKPSLGCEP